MTCFSSNGCCMLNHLLKRKEKEEELAGLISMFSREPHRRFGRVAHDSRAMSGV
jgi:hypothetical protein